MLFVKSPEFFGGKLILEKKMTQDFDIFINQKCFFV